MPSHATASSPEHLDNCSVSEQLLISPAGQPGALQSL